MENPYEKFGAHRCEARVGHGFAWVATFLFLLVCTLAPFWRNVEQRMLGPNGWTPIIELFRYSPRSGTLMQHLREAEDKIEDAEFTRPARQWLQQFGTAFFREGNRQTAVGSDGWLFFRPAIDALTGYGPLQPEPDTVAKDPNRPPWRGPLDAILKFGEQVKGYGAELILLPIPVKPMIYPEHLGGNPGQAAVTHRDAERFFGALRGAGIEVLDLSEEWFARKGESPVFLKQDTHWTPETMEASAARVADFLKQRSWFGGISGPETRFSVGKTETVRAPGDLLEKLDLPEWSRVFAEEEARIRKVTGERGEEISIYDPDSPVVLLGDSFTNIFQQPDMRWGSGAGFAAHLSRELGFSLDTIAQNGQASTGVRRTLATRPGAVARMKRKKAVVWAIAARDLFLSETAAVENQVEWRDVEFLDSPLPVDDPSEDEDRPDTAVIRGRMTMKSKFPSPVDAPYRDGTYAAEYEVLEVMEGDFPGDAALVFHWAFRDKQLQPSAGYAVGDERVLKLVPMESVASAKTATPANDSERFDLVPQWDLASKSITPAPGVQEEEMAPKATVEAEERAARTASIATGLFSLLFGGIIWAVYRKKRAERAMAKKNRESDL